MLEPDFRAVFNASPNAYMLLDRELRFVDANDTYLRLTGTNREALVGRVLFEAFPHDPANPHNENARLLRASLERVLATRAPDSIAFIPYRVEREPGGAQEDRFWSATHTPVLDDQGDVRFILQHTVDVTELHEASVSGNARDEFGVMERARHVQERHDLLDAELTHLRRLFEQAPGFVAVLRGPRHVFEVVNTAYRRLVGGRSVTGKTIREALPEVAGQGFFEVLDTAYATGQPYVGRDVHVRLERQADAPLEDVFVDFVYQPIVDASGAVTGIFVQGHDITAQKRALDELRERAEYERQLIGIVSHDLRNPINAIGVAAALLIKQDQLNPLQAKAVARINSAAERARRMIRDFLDFTQARLHGIPVSPAPANIRQIAAHVYDEVRGLYPDVPAELSHSGDEEGSWDADRIAQLIGNLLTNAFQYGGSSGVPVVLRTSGNATSVVIEVQNGGPPIEAEDRERLFRPFERGAATTPSATRSVGLGLFISREIVDTHHGTIDVRSTADEGTVFTVTLPRHPPTPAQG